MHAWMLVCMYVCMYVFTYLLTNFLLFGGVHAKYRTHLTMLRIATGLCPVEISVGTRNGARRVWLARSLWRLDR